MIVLPAIDFGTVSSSITSAPAGIVVATTSKFIYDSSNTTVAGFNGLYYKTSSTNYTNYNNTSASFDYNTSKWNMKIFSSNYISNNTATNQAIIPNDGWSTPPSKFYTSENIKTIPNSTTAFTVTSAAGTMQGAVGSRLVKQDTNFWVAEDGNSELYYAADAWRFGLFDGKNFNDASLVYPINPIATPPIYLVGWYASSDVVFTPS
jgi:hypothetical protein